MFSDTAKFTQLLFTADNIKAFSGGRPATLSKAEVLLLGDVLKQTVLAENSRTKEELFKIKSLRKYYFQLATVVNKRGEKEVWINAMCRPVLSKWRTVMQLTQDGGNCYFQVRINITTKTAGEMYINGYATINTRDRYPRRFLPLKT